MWKFELCNILFRKKRGKLDFIIFIGEKSSESWTLSFLLAKKARKVGPCHFLCWIKLGKLDFDFFNVGRSSESLTQSFLSQKKHFLVKKKLI